MTALNAVYISPRDRLLRDILIAMRGMSMPELAALADEAQRIHAQRLETEATMQQKLAKPIILEPWALDAMRELVDIVGMLNDGLFVNPQDLGDRLLRCAEGIVLVSGEPHLED